MPEDYGFRWRDTMGGYMPRVVLKVRGLKKILEQIDPYAVIEIDFSNQQILVKKEEGIGAHYVTVGVIDPELGLCLPRQ